tara:strand:- start:3707 stop:4975 length:1269 start_codon:yes stop_codon:yes gene_type:complete
MNLIDKLILLTFPFMDVGFIFFGIPLRIGELTLFLSIFRIINSKSVLKIKKINKNGLIIFSLITLNLIFVIFVNFVSEVDSSFYLKYVLRNFIYISIIFSFLLKPIKYDAIKTDLFIKYILYLVTFFYFVEFFDYYIYRFGWQDLVFVSRQGKAVFKDFMIKFAGQSSEPAYIIPLLSIPLIFGLFTRKYIYVVISLLYMLLSFSSFGYAVILFAFIFFLKSVDDKELLKKVQNFIIKALMIIPFVLLFFYEKIEKLMVHNFEKLQTYFGFGNAQEWSASQRTGHLELAINLFLDSNFVRMMIGNGTGYYSKMSKAFTKYYIDDAEEAHNLYASTLTDRGIIGIIVLVLLFYYISRIKIPKNKNISANLMFFFTAIKFGVYVRMFHWFFTGMLWQYYFWIEVIILMSANAYYIKVRNERERN